MRTRLLLAFACVCARAGNAQDPPAPATPPAPAPPAQDPEKALKALQDKYADDIEDLTFRVETLEKELANSQARSSAAAPQSANVFNPGITVFGNFLARADDQRVFLEDDPTLDRVDDQFLLREFEVDFRAA